MDIYQEGCGNYAFVSNPRRVSLLISMPLVVLISDFRCVLTADNDVSINIGRPSLTNSPSQHTLRSCS
jgi:hypothetical protein